MGVEMKRNLEPDRVWQIVGGKMVNTLTKATIQLGDKVFAGAVVHKCVAVYDDNEQRTAEAVRDVFFGSIIHELKQGLMPVGVPCVVVGFRLLSDKRQIDFDNDRENYSSPVITNSPRRPYLLVSFWPTHKPMLVDPSDVYTDFNHGLIFNWRKYIPRHPDADFREECERKEHERYLKEMAHERPY